MRSFGRTLILLALARAFAGLVILLIFEPNSPSSSLWCLIAFAIALVTDHIDGWIARRYSTPTTTGYLQDAVADKLLHVASLLALSSSFHWLAITLWLVIARELIILSIRVIADSNVDALLKRYRAASLVYAGLLRLGIILLFIIEYIQQSNLPAGFLAVTFLAINCGAAFGLVSIAVMIRAMSKTGRP